VVNKESQERTVWKKRGGVESLHKENAIGEGERRDGCFWLVSQLGGNRGGKQRKTNEAFVLTNKKAFVPAEDVAERGETK